MSGMPIQYCMFAVDETAYCLWDRDLQDRTISFLEDVDPEYFVYLANAHTKAEEGEEQHSALAIRTAYAQALETLFAFLGATLQAPLCVPARLSKYQNKDLDKLIDKIRMRRPIYSSLGYKSLSWQAISEEIHTSLVLEDKEKERMIKHQFGRLWSQFASDFLDEDSGREYNSIKHGFRVKPGGYFSALGLEEQPGIPAPPEKMRTIGRSDFGSSFLVQENICENKNQKHHFQLKSRRINWSPQDMLYGLHFIALSLTNIIAYLKIQNGTGAEEVQFQWSGNEEEYHEPWKRRKTFGMMIYLVDPPIKEDDIEKFTKEQILSVYKFNAKE